MKKVVSIFLTIAILSQICECSSVLEAQNITYKQRCMLEFFQGNSHRVLLSRNNYGYMEFIANFNSDVMSLYLLEMSDKLIQTGSKPSKEKYIEVLVNIIATYDLDNAEDIAQQRKRDNLKKAEDYTLDVLEIGKETVSVLSGNNLAKSGLESSISLAIDGLGILAESTENYLRELSDLETILQNYSKYDEFLRLVEEKSEGDLKDAAKILRDGMKKTIRIKLDTYANVTNKNFDNYTEFFFDNIFFDLAKEIPEYEDESVKAVIDNGDKVLSSFNLIESSWNLGTLIGKLVGNVTVGGEDLINRVLEMMAIYDISVILQGELINLQTEFLNNFETDLNQDVMESYITNANYLIGCRIRGEYCLYSVVANDAKLLSWFNKENKEEAKKWYEVVTENLIYIRDEVRNIESQLLDVSDYFKNWEMLVNDFGMLQVSSKYSSQIYYEKDNFEIEILNNEFNHYTMRNTGCEQIILYGIKIGGDLEIAQKTLLESNWFFYNNSFYKLIDDNLYYISLESDDQGGKVKSWTLLNWTEGEDVSEIWERLENDNEEKMLQKKHMESTTKAKKSYALSDTIYYKLKDCWWTENSSGGRNVKFKREEIEYYDRQNNKIVCVAQIIGYKVLRDGYLIKAKIDDYKFAYFIYKEKVEDVIECYESWKRDPQQYSGSSSLSKGKW